MFLLLNELMEGDAEKRRGDERANQEQWPQLLRCKIRNESEHLGIS
jgi:hypothetical protein